MGAEHFGMYASCVAPKRRCTHRLPMMAEQEAYNPLPFFASNAGADQPSTKIVSRSMCLWGEGV
jgi:hypothetical protein